MYKKLSGHLNVNSKGSWSDLYLHLERFWMYLEISFGDKTILIFHPHFSSGVRPYYKAQSQNNKVWTHCMRKYEKDENAKFIEGGYIFLRAIDM